MVGILITLLLVISTSGCSTINVHAVEKVPLHPYVGTKTAVNSFFSSFVDYDYYGQPFLMIIDVPFCIAADTLLLPYDVVVWVNRKGKKRQR
jgi:uncharacterized protein YceK